MEKVDRYAEKVRRFLIFDAKGAMPSALRIVGRWYSRDKLMASNSFEEIPAVVIGKTPDGLEYPSYACSSIQGRPGDDRVMIISCIPMKAFAKDSKTSLLFLGGFDRPILASRVRNAGTFLALLYPASNFEELEKTIGSIDFQREK